MYFTREPLLETVITPRDGFKLVLRNCKGEERSEFCVEAVEVVSLHSVLFFRSKEKPKSFLVPATDYELLEVREAKMILKLPGIEKEVKIAGGRTPQNNKNFKATKEQTQALSSVVPNVVVADFNNVVESKHQEEIIPASVKSTAASKERRSKKKKAHKNIEDALLDVVSDVTTNIVEVLEEPIRPTIKVLPPPTTLISGMMLKYNNSEEPLDTIEDISSVSVEETVNYLQNKEAVDFNISKEDEEFLF